MNGTKLSFREQFCSYFKCSDAEFEDVALKAFLHWPWSFLSPSVRRHFPALVATDIQIIKQISFATNISDLSTETRSLRSDYALHHDFGLLRKFFKLRLSRKRILRTAKQIWP